jgi:hypothetical protein
MVSQKVSLLGIWETTATAMTTNTSVRTNHLSK